MIRKIILFLVLLPYSLFCQIQTSSYNSLNLISSARSLSLGGDVISIMDNDVSLASNAPSLLNPSMHNQLAFNFVDYVSDINLVSVHFSKQILNNVMVFTGIEAINYGEFVSTDETGNILSNFSANEQIVTIGTSRYLGRNFSIGSNFRLLNSNLEAYNSVSISSNISATYFVREKEFGITCLVKNIGRPLKGYTSSQETLPFQVQRGISKSLDHLPFRYSILLHHLNIYDISNDFSPNTTYDPITNSLVVKEETIAKKLLRHVIIGGELYPFRRDIYLRGGFNFQRQEDLKLSSSFSMTGFSWGFGFSLRKLRIDYSRSALHSSSMVNSFSVTTNLSNFGF